MIIAGLGSYLPDTILDNTEIERRIPETSDSWIQQKLGIKQRRIADPSVCASDLAFFSSIKAISDAGLTVEQIDLIIVATSTPDRISPSTACILQEKLKAKNAAAFDINAVCSGFLYGLHISNAFLKSGIYKNILLVASEVYSKITDWDSKQSVFFGDGSGAVVLQNHDDAFFESKIHSDGNGKESFTVKAGGSYLPASFDTIKQKQHFFYMDGKLVYNTAKKVVPESILALLSEHKMDIKDIGHFIPHQPNINILKEIAHSIDIPFEKVGISMDIYANTAGASIPVTMDLMYKNNLLKKGEMVLMASVGAGWTWGSAIIKWAK
jgi:3-oxoacyl-[acyl-carrier-protein] synthase-3